MWFYKHLCLLCARGLSSKELTGQGDGCNTFYIKATSNISRENGYCLMMREMKKKKKNKQTPKPSIYWAPKWDVLNVLQYTMSLLGTMPLLLIALTLSNIHPPTHCVYPYLIIAPPPKKKIKSDSPKAFPSQPSGNNDIFLLSLSCSNVPVGTPV